MSGGYFPLIQFGSPRSAANNDEIALSTESLRQTASEIRRNDSPAGTGNDRRRQGQQDGSRGECTTAGGQGEEQRANRGHGAGLGDLDQVFPKSARTEGGGKTEYSKGHH